MSETIAPHTLRPFLQSIAEAYASRYADLSEFCFIFPNKRSGTFFLHYLQEASRDRPRLAPKVMAITDFVEETAGVIIDSRIDLLFRLFKCYRAHVASKSGGKAAEAVTFGSFRTWGETALGDFSEADQYLVDHSKLFGNVRDWKQLQANYLTDDQRRVMEEYFGARPDLDIKSFWRHLDADGSQLSEIKHKFLLLWEVMGPVFERLKEDLAADGLALAGTAYRLAAERLEDDGHEVPYKKVVAVGFNALSTSERLIFEHLARRSGAEGEPLADFLWDATGPVLKADDSDATASCFVKVNRKAFPSPDWIQGPLAASETDSLPAHLHIVASPSQSEQAKIAGRIAARYVEQAGLDGISNAKVAVVLPDEGLLIPMLYSLPEGLQDVNLTMGYSLKLTAVASFVSLLRRLYANMRTKDGEPGFYHEHLRSLLAHPFATLLLGAKDVGGIMEHIDGHRIITVTHSALKAISPKAGEMLPALSDSMGAEEVAAYLDSLLCELQTTVMQGADGALLKGRLESDNIATYRAAVERLRQSVDIHRVKLNFRDVFQLVDQLVAAEKVPFDGEPLQGLQVMGMLETRAIDFDYMVIVSANEDILPRRLRKRTFIPDTLRAGYGMPSANYEESIFAYYFYRMISRAREVTMIYDARSGEAKTGEMSRYLRQLLYLHARGRVKLSQHRFRLAEPAPKKVTVEKSPAIMKTLRRYFESDSGKNLSASALNTYCRCQLRFYLSSVCGINDDATPDRFMSAAEIGTVVHEVMQALYLPAELQHKLLKSPRVLTDEELYRMERDDARLQRLMRQMINRHHLHLDPADLDRELPGSCQLIGEQLISTVKKILAHDRKLAPIHIYGVEIAGLAKWPLADGVAVNMKYKVDRLDYLPATGEWRLIDYKTGSPHVRLAQLEEIEARLTPLDYDGEGDAANQLLLYSELLKFDLGLEAKLTPIVYSLSHGMEEEGLRIGEKGKKGDKFKEKDYPDFRASYLQGLNNLISEIFDAETPFVQSPDSDMCKHCVFTSYCQRR